MLVYMVTQGEMMTNFKIGAGIALVLAVLSVFFGAWYRVDEGERAVILRNGAVTGVATPGLGFKLPFFDSLKWFNIGVQSQVYESVEMYSADVQLAKAKITVNYRVYSDPLILASTYTEYTNAETIIERLITPRVMQYSKEVFAKYRADEYVKQQTRFNKELSDAVKAEVTGPVMVTGVLIENVDFTDAFEAAAEARAKAEIEVLTFKQNAEREKQTAQITVTKAQADADAIVARGKAEASAIEARGKALRDNPQLVDLIKAEKWNGVLPTTMLPNGTVPMLNMGSSP